MLRGAGRRRKPTALWGFANMIHGLHHHLLAVALGMLCVFVLVGAKAQTTTSTPQSVFARDSSWNETYSRGRQLFEDNCSACHGEHGHGGFGLPLNLQSFLVIADTGYLLRSMRYGRPLRDMPSFAEDLSVAEMRAIGLYVKSWQYQPSRALQDGTVFGSVRNGSELYRGLCTGCHGFDGRGGPGVGGGHVIGASSGIRGPALADPGFLKSATDGYIKATLMSGRVGTPMGAYLKGRQGFVELREYEIDDIVAYLRSLETTE